MTDKVQKIRAEIERRMNCYDKSGIDIEKYFAVEYEDLLEFIDSMQKEPTTSVWHDTRSEEPKVGRNIVMWHYDHMYSGEYLGERFFGREKFTLMSDSKWAYFEDLTGL